jgi:hypothetical protein
MENAKLIAVGRYRLARKTGRRSAHLKAPVIIALTAKNSREYTLRVAFHLKKREGWRNGRSAYEIEEGQEAKLLFQGWGVKRPEPAVFDQREIRQRDYSLRHQRGIRPWLRVTKDFRLAGLVRFLGSMTCDDGLSVVLHFQ